MCVCPCESVLVVTLGRVRLCFSLSGPQAYMYLITLPEYSFLELLLESWRARRIERRDQTRLNSIYKQLGSSNPSLSCSHNTAIGVVVSGLLIQQTLAMLLVTPTPRQSHQPSAGLHRRGSNRKSTCSTSCRRRTPWHQNAVQPMKFNRRPSKPRPTNAVSGNEPSQPSQATLW